MARICSCVVSAGVIAVLSSVTACSGGVGAGGAGQSEPGDKPLESNVVSLSQRSAYGYAEAVVIEPNDAHADLCTGVLIAPKVVLTAAHCIVYVPAQSWKVTAPFAMGGPEAHTARDGEPMDAAFRNVSAAEYAQHDLADVGMLYLDVPFANVKTPTLTPDAFPAGQGSPPIFVSAVGRSSAGAQAGLALSAATMLQTPASARSRIEYETGRLGAPGESGGPLFVEGTHQLVAVLAHPSADGKTDAWTRLDGGVYTWLTQKVSEHGGWQRDESH